MENQAGMDPGETKHHVTDSWLLNELRLTVVQQIHVYRMS